MLQGQDPAHHQCCLSMVPNLAMEEISSTPVSTFHLLYLLLHGIYPVVFSGIFLTMKLHQFLEFFSPFSPHKQRIWDSMRVLPCFHVGNYFELEEVYTSLEITWRSEGLTIQT